MNKNKRNERYRRVPTEFAPETKFEVNPAPFRRAQESKFEVLKGDLLAERLAAIWEADLNSLVRRAANEAAALAWVTPYPLLVFPVLFEEKANLALIRAEKQEQVRQRSRELLAV